MTSIFSNMDYLFWRTPNIHSEVPWIIWYIWKVRNEKLFKNLDRDPREILQIADTEATLLLSAQSTGQESKHVNLVSSTDFAIVRDPQCYIDGLWKAEDSFYGLGWFYLQSAEAGVLMGARNVHWSLSPLHVGLEALIWAMYCLTTQQKTEVAFATDITELLKMVVESIKWPAFAVHLKELEKLKEAFSLSYVLRLSNSKVDMLARST